MDSQTEEASEQEPEMPPRFTDIKKCLKDIFGYDTFLPNQREVIEATKLKEDVLAVIPTGGGKSLTFQLAAVTDPGVTFVIMPLLSLIEDNKTHMTKLGISVCALTSSTDEGDDLYARIRKGVYKIVYTTPEKINQYHDNILGPLNDVRMLDRFVFDEIHCVYIWGQDFRQAYRDFKLLKLSYPDVPLLGLTATANDKLVGQIES